MHPGSPAALEDFNPSQCPCCCQCSCLAAPSLGFISDGKDGRVLLPGSFAAYAGCWEREGAGGSVSEALNCSQGLHTTRYPALSSSRAADTQRQPWSHPPVRSLPLLSNEGGQALGEKMQQQRALRRQSCQAYSPGLK